jgi:hypothetical protein
MAENVVTLHLRTKGVPRDWMSRTVGTLVTERLAASGDIFERPDQDNGLEVLARLETRLALVASILDRTRGVAEADLYAYQGPDTDRILKDTA